MTNMVRTGLVDRRQAGTILPENTQRGGGHLEKFLTRKLAQVRLTRDDSAELEVEESVTSPATNSRTRRSSNVRLGLLTNGHQMLQFQRPDQDSLKQPVTSTSSIYIDKRHSSVQPRPRLTTIVFPNSVPKLKGKSSTEPTHNNLGLGRTRRTSEKSEHCSKACEPANKTTGISTNLSSGLSAPASKKRVKSQRLKKIPSSTTKNRNMAGRYGTSSNPGRPVGFQNQEQQHQTGDDASPNRNSTAPETESNTPQRHGNFTIIPPNQKKRNKMMSQSQRDDEAYQAYRAHKESQRPNHVQISPQSVGGSKSQEEIIRQRQREQQDAKYKAIMKRRQWDREKKEKEEAENRAKKEKAREQARRNEQQRAERQNFRDGAWSDDHVRTNEQFLQRLEQQSKQKQANSAPSSQYRGGRMGDPWSVD